MTRNGPSLRLHALGPAMTTTLAGRGVEANARGFCEIQADLGV